MTSARRYCPNLGLRLSRVFDIDTLRRMKSGNPPASATGVWRRVGALTLVMLGALLPLVPILVGVALKFAFIDDVPKDAIERQKFILDEYARPLWLDLIVAAYILPIGFIISEKISGTARAAALLIPAGLFVVCIFSVLGLPKLGIDNSFWRIQLPDYLGVLSLVVVGTIIARNAK